MARSVALDVNGRAVTVSVDDPDGLLARLRGAEVPVIARIHEGAVLLDPRTIADGEVEAAATTVRAALVGVGSLDGE